MEEKFISEFEQALKDEFDQKRKVLDAEYKRRLEAFHVACGKSSIGNHVFVSYGDALTPLNRPRFAGGGEGIPVENPSILKAVKEALRHVDGNFSVRDLVPIINSLFPALSVDTSDLSNPLWNLSENGEIEKVIPGIGRNPHIYRKIQ